MIVLMRHAEPDFDTSMRVRTSDMSGVLAAYDEAGIKRTRDGRRRGEIMPPAVGKEGRDGSSVQVVTSNLRRSIESAKLFFPHLEPRRDRYAISRGGTARQAAAWRLGDALFDSGRDFAHPLDVRDPPTGRELRDGCGTRTSRRGGDCRSRDGTWLRSPRWPRILQPPGRS